MKGAPILVQVRYLGDIYSRQWRMQPHKGFGTNRKL